MYTGRLSVIPVAAVLAIVVLCGCTTAGSSRPASETAVDTGTIATGEITNDQLSRMVFPKEDWGPAYASFVVDPDSGFVTNEEEIDDDSCDTDAAADVEAFGRVMGYDQSFLSEEARNARVGTFLLGTEVTLYESAEGARDETDDSIEESSQDVGTTCEDITLVSYDEFDASGVGEAAYGADAVVEILTPAGERVRAYGTGVDFVRGRVLASAFLVGFEDLAGQHQDVLNIARKLDQRILATLAETSPEPEGPDATSLLGDKTLRLADVPPGFYLGDSTLYRLEELLADQDPATDSELARRRAESWGFQLGSYQEFVSDDSSGLFGVYVDIWLLEDAAGAENAFLDGALILAVPEIETRDLPEFPPVGDESLALGLSGRDIDPTGTEIDVEGFQVMFHVGRYLASIRTVAPAGTDHQAQVVELARTLEQRLRGE